ncbi:MAG: tetratricopeptide repeat protein [Planctomycetaceae bacterium]|nr:tetratricopeptide repeat protein [Planctomycetaceae bacterium]
MKAAVVVCVGLIGGALVGAPVFGQQSPPAAAGGSLDPRGQLKRDADAAYRNRDFPTAIKLASQVLKDAPNDAVAYYLRGSARVELGITHRDANLIREGIEDARRAIEEDTRTAGAANQNLNFYLPYLFGMSNLTALEGETHHAQTALSVATDVAARAGITPATRGNVLYQRALAHSKLGDDASAAADLRRTLEIDTNHLAARFALGEALLRTGDATAAEEVYSTAIELFPENPLVFNNRGIFYQSQQRSIDAIADFSRAIELDPDHLEAHLNRGFARLNTGEYAAAQADFTKAVELQPDHAPAHSLLATSKLLQNNLRDAFADYLKVIELRPHYAPARADIAFAYFFARQYDTAAQAFEQAMVLAPDSRFLLPWRYAALALAGREDAARHAFRAISEKAADQRDWFDLLTLFMMGRIEERDLLAAIDSQNTKLRDAQLCEAYYFIGLRLQKEKQGDPKRYFQRAVESKATQLSAYRAAKLELGRPPQ